jgi:hypothetical protein
MIRVYPASLRQLRMAYSDLGSELYEIFLILLIICMEWTKHIQIYTCVICLCRRFFKQRAVGKRKKPRDNLFILLNFHNHLQCFLLNVSLDLGIATIVEFAHILHVYW